MEKMRLNRKGLTLVEIMIVVAIIGILAAIVIPNSIRSRATAEKNICLANLRTLQSTLEMAAFFDGATIEGLTNDDAIRAVVMPASGTQYMKAMPSCLTTGGVYSTDTDGVVHCSVHAPGDDNGNGDGGNGGVPPASPFF